MSKIASIGEVMIELAPYQAPSDNSNVELKQVSFAGDTYNTAVTLARLNIETSYITHLGQDNYSSKICEFLVEEGVDTNAVSVCESKNPGLYMIENIEGGERIFHYWRNQSAARDLFNSEERRNALKKYLTSIDWLYFSAISLGILDDASREYFFDLLGYFKEQGGKIAYDSNFRPRLWNSNESAQKASMRSVKLADLALLTLDDEAELWNCEMNPLDYVKALYANVNTEEIVFKRGANDVVVLRNGMETRVPVTPVKQVVDTTAAGDTFNAGYIASHIRGGSPAESAKLGSRCAGIIIQHRGGVIDKQLFLNELEQFQAEID